MGRITAISTVGNGGATIQNNSYVWFKVGNLKSRSWQAKDPTSEQVYNRIHPFLDK